MKTYKYLYQKMLDEDLIRRAYLKLRKGKTTRKEIKYIDAHLDEEVRKMRIMLENTKPCEVPHPELAFKPLYHKAKIINENGKNRKIYMPEMREQWVHHIIIMVLQPIVLSTVHPNACGSYPKRGAHYGKKIIEKWMKNRRETKFFCKLDIRHFYDNIRHKVLFRELRNHIKDNWFIHIIKVCLSQFKKGLPLGFYISQWLANYILEPLDKLQQKLTGKNIRYIDDMVMFNSSIRCLKTAVNKTAMMLGNRFYLILKGNYQVCKFGDDKVSGRPLDYMGFVFYRDKTIMRKKIMIKATRLAKKIAKKEALNYRIYRKWISGFLSYNGWFKGTNSYNCFLKYIKPYVKIGRLKKIISAIDRRRNKKNDRVERNQNGRKSRTVEKDRAWLIPSVTQDQLCFS